MSSITVMQVYAMRPVLSAGPAISGVWMEDFFQFAHFVPSSTVILVKQSLPLCVDRMVLGAVFSITRLFFRFSVG